MKVKIPRFIYGLNNGVMTRKSKFPGRCATITKHELYDSPWRGQDAIKTFRLVDPDETKYYVIDRKRLIEIVEAGGINFVPATGGDVVITEYNNIAQGTKGYCNFFKVCEVN